MFELPTNCTSTFAVIGALFVLYKVVKFLKSSYTLMKLYVKPTLTDFKKYGEWAVITGATDGIGKALAHQFAARGIPVILISRNAKKLEQVSKEIENQHEVETRVLAIDFNTSDPEIYERIGKFMEGVDVGVLVNNVGTFPPLQRFIDIPTNNRACYDAVNVNVLSVFRMCQIILPGMKERKRGLIMNLSSMSALRPVPYIAVYGSTKALVDYFSRALAIECADCGIEVQSVLPSYVETNMSLNKGWGFFACEVNEYAKSLLGTAGKVGRTHGCLKHEIQCSYFGIAADSLILAEMKKTSLNWMEDLEEFEKNKQT